LWSCCVDCVITKIYEDDGIREFTIQDKGKECHKSTRKVIYYTSTYEAKCSCKMFQLEGISCRHILIVLRGDFLKEIPKSLLLNRWTKTATRQPIFYDRGMLLEGCMKEKSKCQLVTTAWGAFYEVMHYAEPNEEDLKMVIEMCNDMKKKMAVSGAKVISKSKDLESFVGCSLPDKIEIHPPKNRTILRNNMGSI